MSTPQVSIIIPTYNRAHLISRTLDSILLQNYKNWECIVIDDGSKDNTEEVIKSYKKKDSRFKYFQRPVDRLKGANACRNFGLEKSKGSYINWFDSDDTMHSDFIKKKLEAFNINQTLDIVFSKTIKIFNNRIPVYENRTKVTNNLLEDYITKEVSWYLPDGMLKRTFLKNKIMFDETLKGGQDRDFYIKVLILNPKVVIIDFYATNYFIHAKSISSVLYTKNNTISHLNNFSHFESLINQIDLLSKKKLLSQRLKKHYFDEIKKKIPSIIKGKSTSFLFYKTLMKLTSVNIFYVREWIKIITASLSFIIIGKGERFLK